MSIVVSPWVIAPAAARKTSQAVASAPKYRTAASQFRPVVNVARNDRHNASAAIVDTTLPAVRRIRSRNRSVPKEVPLSKKTAKEKAIAAKKSKGRLRAPTPTMKPRQNEEPTPQPTGDSSASTTVYIESENAFALLLPRSPGEMVSDAEGDSIAYCTDGSGCGNSFPDGFITGAAYWAAEDGSYVQITGCMDSSQFPFASGDNGGQFDVRFPDGAQCIFGGYGASFIEL